MRISVIGCGYLGAVHAASIAELGHEVVGVDVDPGKVSALSAGEAPFFEPGLPEILRSAGATGRLSFTTAMPQVRGARVHFIAVGTPQSRGSNSADLTYVDAAVDALIPHLSAGDLVVGKSTVPVGTAARLAQKVKDSGSGALLAWNPEFLREGFAVKDTVAPDRLVYGLPEADADAVAAKALLDEVYATALGNGTPLVTADYQTAELVKVAANAFLATKISFINAMAEIAEVADADVTKLADAIGYDARIGRRFLNAGIGFGGGCLPKDIRAFMARAGELGADQTLTFLREVDSINMRRRIRIVDLAREVCEGSLIGKRVAVLGAAFKPLSDDIRDSPALNVAAQIRLQGGDVVLTDPAALDNARKALPDISYAETVEEAVRGAHVVLLLTEWREYRDLDPVALKQLVRTPLIIDGRNILDPDRWRAAGWTYLGMGRP